MLLQTVPRVLLKRFRLQSDCARHTQTSSRCIHQYATSYLALVSFPTLSLFGYRDLKVPVPRDLPLGLDRQ